MADLKGPVPPYQEHQPTMQHQQSFGQASPINQIAPVPIQHQQSYNSGVLQQQYQQVPQQQQQQQFNQQVPQQQYIQQAPQQQPIYANPNMAQSQPGPQPNFGDEHKGQPQQVANTLPPTAAQSHQYHTVTPLGGLQSGPTPVDCPSCHVRGLTRIDFESGNTTYAWALGLCCLIGLGCIPFCMTSLKDVAHYCSHCGCRLATWHRSGRTEVHMHA